MPTRKKPTAAVPPTRASARLRPVASSSDEVNGDPKGVIVVSDDSEPSGHKIKKVASGTESAVIVGDDSSSSGRTPITNGKNSGSSSRKGKDVATVAQSSDSGRRGCA